MRIVAMAALLKIEFPDHTLRLVDGGFLEFEGEIYKSHDDIFGTVASFSAMADGIGDSIPAAEIVFMPKDTAAMADLASPAYQGSRVRSWIAEYDTATGLIIVVPQQRYEHITDRPVATLGRGKRLLAIETVPRDERMFLINDGNSLNDTYHQSIYPGELGHANANDLSVAVAWGVAAPQRGVSSGTGGGGGSGGGADRFEVDLN